MKKINAYILLFISVILVMAGCTNEYENIDKQCNEIVVYSDSIKSYLLTIDRENDISTIQVRKKGIYVDLIWQPDSLVNKYFEAIKSMNSRFKINKVMLLHSHDIVLLQYGKQPGDEWFESKYLVVKEHLDRLDRGDFEILHENKCFYLIQPYGELFLHSEK